MDFNTEARYQQLEQLQQFILSSKEKVQFMFNELGWQRDRVVEDNHFITCSLDTGHKIPQKSVDQHIKKCTLRKEGYDLNEQFLSEPVGDPKSSVLIDDYKKIEILSEFRKTKDDFKSGWNGQDPDPKTSDRLISTFSSHERLALYNYAASFTVGPPNLSDFDVLNPKKDNSKPLTYKEQLAQERDAKRRRIKHKAIHTSHKSHMEVLREVIEGQMDLYKEWLGNVSDAADIDHKSGIVSEDKKESKDFDGKIGAERDHSSSRNSTRSGSSRKCYNEDSAKNKLTRTCSPDGSNNKTDNCDQHYYCAKSKSSSESRRENDDCFYKKRDDASREYRTYRARSPYRERNTYRRSPHRERIPYRDRSSRHARSSRRHHSRESRHRSRDKYGDKDCGR